MIKWFKRKDQSGADQETESTEQANGPESVDETAAAEQMETLPAEPEAEEEETESTSPFDLTEDFAAEVELEDEPESDEAPTKGRFFRKLRQRLHKTRSQFVTRVDRLVLGRKIIDNDLLDDLEEIFITSDLGVRTTQLLLDRVAEKVKRQELKDPEKLRDHLREEIESILAVDAPPWDVRRAHPLVIMVVGVNGVGKTTTIGKLANQLKQQGLNVLLVAGDTFRAAAIEQLVAWGERVETPVVKQKTGSDPSAVAFDALDSALARDVDVVVVDTAGRMHTKVNLMQELKKVQRVIQKKLPDAPHEVLLVLDATTGQNAASQVRLFNEGIGLTGLILTKLDGTAKGGIIVSISDEYQLPVRYIGIGEGIEDLQPFDPEEFTKALF